MFLGAGAAVAAPIEQGLLGGFSIDSTRTAGAGALAGFDIVKFIAINNGKGETLTSTKLQSVNITMTNLGAGNLKLDFRDLDGDGEPDGNIVGSGLAFATGNATFIRVGNNAATFNAVNVVPAAGSDILPTGNPDGVPDRQPSTMPEFTTQLKQIRVEGFQPPASSPTATGAGSTFAVAVVPTGNPVRIQGAIAAEAGTSVSVNYTDPVPEPATLGFIGLGGIALLSRRRRTA